MAAPVAFSAPLPALTPLEISSGIVVGRAPQPIAAVATPTTPIIALANAVRPALQRGTCLISFSGGHDSTLVLAVATRVARDEGLALPVPITFRFVDAPRALESERQETVIAELGLTDWVRLTVDSELDWVGPFAQDALRTQGVRYPPNSFMHGTMLTHATGGTLLTGVGGDQLFHRSHRPRRPWPVGRPPAAAEGFPWLHRSAGRKTRHALLREGRRLPRDPAHRSRWRVESRAVALGQQSVQAHALACGAMIEHPLLDAGFLSAVESFGMTPNAAGGRAQLLAQMFAGEVPKVCLDFHPKAIFNEVFWNEHAREHIRTWNGSGVDESIVDVEGLRAWWQRDRQFMFTAMLLQQTWLAQHGSTTSEASSV